MVATAAMSVFFPVIGSGSSTKMSMRLRGIGSECLDARGKTKLVWSLKFKVYAAVLPKINENTVSCRSKDDDVATAQRTIRDRKPWLDDMLPDLFHLGKIVQEGLVFHQMFLIRSYEIGAHRTVSIETMMNHLQESAFNHVKSSILGDEFGSTPEMSLRSLIWVVVKMQILVDRYPIWGGVVKVDTWFCRSGKNRLCCDWLIRDGNTGETLTRASSVWAMMNRKTRRLSKIPDEVREEFKPHILDCTPIVVDDGRKLPKLEDSTADYVKGGLTPRWNDLDANQHVNNVKYVGLILESAPHSILNYHELVAITLEYRKECGCDSRLQSLTSVCGNIINTSSGVKGVECEHLLCLESGPEIVRARSKWRPLRIPR